MLEFSDVSMLHNKTLKTLIYLVKIPNLSKRKSKNIIVKPVFKNLIIHIENKSFFHLNTEIDERKQNCKELKN